ncbi:hypothetical protein ACLMJK_002985 [Lecanora helva]
MFVAILSSLKAYPSGKNVDAYLANLEYHCKDVCINMGAWRTQFGIFGFLIRLGALSLIWATKAEKISILDLAMAEAPDQAVSAEVVTVDTATPVIVGTSNLPITTIQETTVQVAISPPVTPVIENTPQSAETKAITSTKSSTSSSASTSLTPASSTSIGAISRATVSTSAPGALKTSSPKASVAPSGLSSSAKIGIGLGVPLGLIILAILASAAYFLRKRNPGSLFTGSINTATDEAKTSLNKGRAKPTGKLNEAEETGQALHEKDGINVPAFSRELPGSPGVQRHELSAVNHPK